MTDAAEPAPDDPVEPGNLQLALPAGWVARHQVTLELPAPRGEFRPNIVVQWAPLVVPAPTIDEVCAERRRLLGRHLPRFEFGLSLWFLLRGQRAVRMMYTWHDGTHRLRQALVLCASGGWLYELTYSDTSVRFAASVPQFDAWLETLALPT